MAERRKLPVPIDGTQEYLAAVLDELRALHELVASLAATAQRSASTVAPAAPNPAPTPSGGSVPVPVAKKPPVKRKGK